MRAAGLLPGSAARLVAILRVLLGAICGVGELTGEGEGDDEDDEDDDDVQD